MKIQKFKGLLNVCALVGAALCALSFSAAADTSQTWDEKYKEEPYVILRSERTVEIRKDFTTLTTVRMVAKIQKEGGKKLGEIPVTYDKSREEVKDIQAFTITPEGEKLKHQEIQELTPKKELAVYSDERIKMVTMPHVVAGSIIDWQTTIESTKPVIENNFYDMVYFSSTIPVKAQKYTLIAPKDIALHIKCLNKERKPAVSYSEDKVIYTWENANNEKVDIEEHMPFWDEVYEAVAVSTLDSWEEMSKWAWKLFRKNLLLSNDMKKKVYELTKDKGSTTDKVQALIEYIQEDFRYVSMAMDFHGYEPHPSDQVFSNKYGDCKDHTLLGMAMLSEIGVRAYPVLFPSSMSLNGGGDLLPLPTYFNHAILFFEIDGKRYYSDLLRKGYYFYEIPDAMSGKKVFVVNEKGGFVGTVPRTDEAESVSIIKEHVVIQDSGDAVSEVTVLFPRNLSISMREKLKSVSNDMREKVFAGFEAALASGGKVLEREWQNLDTPHDRISVRLKYESSHQVQRVGNMMMFGMSQHERGTTFTAPKRKYPIVFHTGSREERWVTYSIPEGYEIVNLPKEVVLNYDFGGFERSYRMEGNSIYGKEMSASKESRTPADQYQTIRNFYDDMTKMTNDLIMIKKKG